MQVAKVARALVFVVVGVVLVGVGIGLYSSCTQAGGPTSPGSSGGTSYPSGCGATLVVAIFGAIFGLLGVVAAVQAARTTDYVPGPWRSVIPPAIFTPPQARPPAPPNLPSERCQYCGSENPSGSLRCRSCGAPL